MEPDLATELSAEVESLKSFLSQSRQRIRQIARRAGFNTDQDKIDVKPSDVTRLLNLLNEILSLTFTDLETVPTPLCDPLGSIPTYDYPDDHGDAFDHCEVEVDVKEELCSSPIHEDLDEFDPLYIPNEEDLGIVIKPDRLDRSNNNDNDPDFVLKSSTGRKPPGPRIKKFRQSRKEKVTIKRNTLSHQHVKNTNSSAKNLGSAEIKKDPAERDIRLVLDRLSKRELAKWKVQKPQPLQDSHSDDDDDSHHPDRDDADDDYILPDSNPPSDDEYIPDLELAPSRKQKACPASKKRNKTSIKKSPVACPHCGLVSSSINTYRRHKHLFHSANKAPRPRKAPISQCHLCDLKFGSKTSLTTHLATIHATRPLDDITEFEVTDRPIGRTKFRQFRCPDCSKIIGQVQNFLNHRLIHSGEKPHLCPTCGLAFRKKGTLQRHCESQHLKEKKTFLCEHCPKSFLFKYTLVTHQNLMHPEGPRVTFSCDKCSKQFNQKSNLDRHKIVVHEKRRPFQCTMCDKAFKMKPHLRAHEKTHENPGGRKRGLNREKEPVLEEEDSMHESI